MRHGVDGRKLGRPTDHRMAMFRNLVTDLLRYERIKTTEAKAKETRVMAEKIISLGKGGTLHDRRRALAFLTDERVVEKVFNQIGPRYSDRHGGYTRIVKVGPRLGDGAEIVQLELI